MSDQNRLVTANKKTPIFSDARRMRHHYWVNDTVGK